MSRRIAIGAVALAGTAFGVPAGAHAHSGEHDELPRDALLFLLPNTVLYSGTQSNCCILGLHTYDLELGDDTNGNQERRYVVSIATWLSPGVLSGPEDVSALSHELVEAVNDPFVGTDAVHNLTPWWQEPLGRCQNKNELGDVVEELPGAVFTLTMPQMTYHLQNAGLLSWFQPGHASTAIDAAFSYPDETLLTAPTPLLPPFCQ